MESRPATEVREAARQPPPSVTATVTLIYQAEPELHASNQKREARSTQEFLNSAHQYM